MTYDDLYLNIDRELTRSRYDQLKERFNDKFGFCSDDFFSASGRAEIVGNHTDHNHGKVLVAAINRDVVANVSKANDNFIKIYSLGFDPNIIDISDLSLHDGEMGTSTAMVKGILNRFVELGYKIGSFVAVTSSNVNKGSGVSSSAAFELLICEILNYYFNDKAIDPMTMAKVAQFSENNYFGKPSGLLDQSGIALGGLTFIDFYDYDNPKVEKLTPPDFSKQMLIIFTEGDHANLTDAYAEIKSDMSEFAHRFGKEYLAEVSDDDFYSIPEENSRQYKRAEHFFEENRRVDHTVTAIKENDEEMFYICLSNSGYSSRNKLLNCKLATEQSSPITEALDFVVSVDKDAAVRVHGGGFRGTILACVDKTDEVLNKLNENFGKNNVAPIAFRTCGATKVDYKELFGE